MKTDNLTSSFLALRDKLHRSALGFLKNDEDARDALQDTFFNLWRIGGAETENEARNKLFAVLTFKYDEKTAAVYVSAEKSFSNSLFGKLGLRY